MPAQPKVTIWIPSYNRARYLPAAIESALGQTYRNIEIVIVDDGSTDESLAIAQGYAERHPDIVRVFTHPGHVNRGISATVNLCFEKSTGTYVSGLPCDDMLHPRKVAEQVAYLERHKELGWVYGYAFYVDENNRRRPELGLFGHDLTRWADPVEHLMLRNVICGVAVLMRRDVVSDVGPHDPALVFSDWDFWLRLAASSRMGFLPRARVRYRVHSRNTSVGISDETGARHCLAVMHKLRSESERLPGPLARPRTRALLDLQCAFFSYALQDEEAARLHLADAFVTDPSLKQDPHYLRWWLRHCQRFLNLRATPLPMADFPSWVRTQLSQGSDEDLRPIAQHIGGWRLGRANGLLSRAGTRWEFWRIAMDSLLHDPRAWQERELLALHAEALGGFARRGLARLVRASGSQQDRPQRVAVDSE